MFKRSNRYISTCVGSAVGGCNLCGSTKWTTLELHGSTQVVQCRCDLVFVTPVPARSVIERTYQDEYYEAWETQERARRVIWERRVAAILRLVERPGRLLDVGCGDGMFLDLAHQHGWTVTGTELSAAAAFRQTRWDIKQGEVWEAGLPSDSFDLVTSWHVIEHASDPTRMMREIYRVLKPEGRLVLATPNLNDYIFRFAYLAGRLRWPTLYEEDERELHLFHFTTETLARLMSSVGFINVRVGFDRGAAAVPGKQLVNSLAYGWYRLTGVNWGIGLELTAGKPGHASRVFQPGEHR